MIASQIGRTFLKAFNQKYNKNYSPQEFFDNVYFELFLNHPKYMQWVTNSPFVQMKKGQKPSLLNEVERKEKLDNLHCKINDGYRDASIVIGYPASEEEAFATTSGLVSDIDFQISNDDVYYSWIGSALGIGVAGGFSILFDNPEILLATFEGWQIYRKVLNDRCVNVAGNKINSWNGQWLHYRFDEDYKESPDFSKLTSRHFFSEGKDEESGLQIIDTVKWSKLFFSLSRKLQDKTLTGYVYSLSQTNTTIGFIPFRFNHATSLIYTYKKLFGDFNSMEQREDYENLFGIHIKKACELGSIGIQALRPKDLEKYFKEPNKKFSFTEPTTIKKGETEDDFTEREKKTRKKQYEELITFRAYKAWMVAMITKNKEELLDYTKDVAQKLLSFCNEDKKISTKRGHLADELFLSKSKKIFLSNLIEILNSEKDENKEYLKKLRDEIHLMNNEDFGYFVTLLKFDYVYQAKQH